MEIWEVVAVDKNHVITIKAEGKKIPGIKLLLRDPNGKVGDRERYLGFVWLEQFISNERLAMLQVTPMPGDKITLIFNRFGDIVECNIVEPDTV